ncbi:hypothetical protein OUZ56_005443 [Daphnia magna]|uniref:Uncharacterized protein n=1 Tax=Daphnia magna TaxID=35525 RepID=A0ABQ9YSU4_9CRUS|nr:hypothetical protein OUZ56_005443 [Daphnia magna]
MSTSNGRRRRNATRARPRDDRVRFWPNRAVPFFVIINQSIKSVMMTLVQNQNALQFYNLKISGGSPAKRRAAAQEVIEGLPVTIECSNVDLRQLRHLKMRSSETEFFVSVRRPMSRDEKLQLSGRINDCRKAFNLLVNGRDPRPSPK